MTKKLGFCVVVLVGLSSAASVAQAAIVVDGLLGDWSVDVLSAHTTGSVGGTNYDGIETTPGFIGAHIEDTKDLSTSSYLLGPNYGGQNYDAEMMAVTLEDNSRLAIAILTGQRPDNGLTKYSPGDIRITTEFGRIFGIEVGGGEGGSSAANIITEGANGSFYTVSGSGYTESVDTSPSTLAGQLWETTFAGDNSTGDHRTEYFEGWIYDPLDPKREVQLQPNLASDPGAVLLGSPDSVDFVFTRNGANGDTYGGTSQHSVIELAFDYGLLGLDPDDQIESIEWRPSCGNDELIVSPTGGFGPEVVPEPASVLVWGCLSLAFASFGFRRRFRGCVK